MDREIKSCRDPQVLEHLKAHAGVQAPTRTDVSPPQATMLL